MHHVCVNLRAARENAASWDLVVLLNIKRGGLANLCVGRGADSTFSQENSLVTTVDRAIWVFEWRNRKSVWTKFIVGQDTVKDDGAAFNCTIRADHTIVSTNSSEEEGMIIHGVTTWIDTNVVIREWIVKLKLDENGFATVVAPLVWHDAFKAFVPLVEVEWPDAVTNNKRLRARSMDEAFVVGGPIPACPTWDSKVRFRIELIRNPLNKSINREPLSIGEGSHDFLPEVTVLTKHFNVGWVGWVGVHSTGRLARVLEHGVESFRRVGEGDGFGSLLVATVANDALVWLWRIVRARVLGNKLERTKHVTSYEWLRAGSVDFTRTLVVVADEEPRRGRKGACDCEFSALSRIDWSHKGLTVLIRKGDHGDLWERTVVSPASRLACILVVRVSCWLGVAEGKSGRSVHAPFTSFSTRCGARLSVLALAFVLSSNATPDLDSSSRFASTNATRLRIDKRDRQQEDEQECRSDKLHGDFLNS